MSAIGWLIAAGGVALLYLSLRPHPSDVASVASKLGGSPGATTDLNPGKPPIVGIPSEILPSTYAECITKGGKWNFNAGDCVYAG